MNIAGLQVVLPIFIATGCFNIVKGSELLRSTYYVCEGDSIPLTCSTMNGTHITWTATLPDNCNDTVSLSSVFVSQSLTVPNPPDTVLCNTHLYFLKSSNSSLTSTMLMVNVTSDVNGIRVECRHQDGNESTVIHVVKGVPDVVLRVASEMHSADNVTVQLEYDKEPGVTYNLTVLDLTTMSSSSIRLSGFHNSSIPLTLCYNTEYRVSFTASRCGQSSLNVTDFHFGNGTGVNCADSTMSQSGTVIMTTPTGLTFELISTTADSSIVTGVSVGVAIVVVVLVIVILSLISTLVIKTRRKAERSDKTSPTFTCTLRPTEQEITENNQGPEAHNADNSGPVQKQTFGIIYADVGTNPKPNSVKLIVDDSSRVDYAQIRIQSLCSLNEVDTHPKCEETKDNPHTLDDSLNLDSLLIQVKPEVTSKWYSFGQALGVDNKLLDSYLPYPPEQNIVEVCDNWLRNHTGKPAWWEIAEALKKTDFHQLAYNIERVYETGSLPKAVEMNANLKEFLDEGSAESPPALPPRSY